MAKKPTPNPVTFPHPLATMDAFLAGSEVLGMSIPTEGGLVTILPSVALIGDHDGEAIMRHLEAAIRTAYKSEDKIGPDSHLKILKHILSLKHESTMEHHNFTFRIVTSRGVAFELVRHRLASYTQESTRYVNYGKRPAQVILPWHLVTKTKAQQRMWVRGQRASLGFYQKAIAQGWTPQEARGFLSNDIKTEIVMTMNIRSLRNFLGLRTASSAHPDMQVIAREVLRILMGIVPLLFQDIAAKNEIPLVA